MINGSNKKRMNLWAIVFLICLIVETGCGAKSNTSNRPSTDAGNSQPVEEGNGSADGVDIDSDKVLGVPVDPELEAVLTKKYGADIPDYSPLINVAYKGVRQIESEHIVWDIYENVCVTDEQIELAEKTLKIIEEVSDMRFFGCKYSPRKKIVIVVEQNSGSFSADGSAKTIYIDESAFTNEYGAFIHELYHVLQGCACYDFAYPFIIEGHASYWQYRTEKYIYDKQIEGLCELVSVEDFQWVYYEQVGALSITELDTKKLLDWMDQSCYFRFDMSWPAYIYGRALFQYLEETGNNPDLWYLAGAKIPYETQGTNEDRKFMDNEQMYGMLCDVYGTDTIKGFYPWVKENIDYLKGKGFR